jgi:hypothetical protein
VHATIPLKINYQGRLSTSQGIPSNGSYKIEFRIYDDPTAGNLKWSETDDPISVANGVFSVMMGSNTPVDNTVFDGTVRYLELWVGISGGSTEKLSPRFAMVSVPNAYISEKAYGVIGATITSANIVDGTISTTDLASDFYNAFVSKTGSIVTGNIGVSGYLRISTTSIIEGQKLLLKSANVENSIEIQGANTDAQFLFQDPNDYAYSMGIDYSDSSKFKINYGSTIGENTHFVMNSAGNVGIHTASPAAPLEIFAVAGCTSPSYPAGTVAGFLMNADPGNWSHIAVISGNNGVSCINLGDKDDPNIGQVIYVQGNNAMYFTANAGYRAYLDSVEQFGIATLPDTKFRMAGSLRVDSTLELDYNTTAANSTGLYIYVGDNTNVRSDYYYVVVESAGDGLVVYRKGGTKCAHVNSSSGWVAGCSREIKHDIVPLLPEEYLNLRNMIKNQPLYSYKRDDVPDEPEVGFISEETSDIMGSDGNGITYSKTLGYLSAVVKIQDAKLKQRADKIDQLRKELKELDVKLTELEKQ